jgi:hypothetical protein
VFTENLTKKTVVINNYFAWNHPYILQIPGSWDVMPCTLVTFTSNSEDRAASFFRIKE